MRCAWVVSMLVSVYNGDLSVHRLLFKMSMPTAEEFFNLMIDAFSSFVANIVV